MPHNRKQVDWERVEAEYRAGQLSVVEIGRQSGVTEGAIRKRAKRDNWKRDLSGRVREEIRARLVRDNVPEEKQSVGIDQSDEGTTDRTLSTIGARTVSDDETIEVAAARGVAIVREHRADIRTQRNLVRTLVSELQAGCKPERQQELEAAIEVEEEDGRRRAAMLRAVSLPTRAGVMRELATAGKILIELERQAFSLDDPRVPNDNARRSDDDIIREIAEIERRARLAAQEGTLAEEVSGKPSGVVH